MHKITENRANTMPTVRTNGVDTYYERFGEGPPLVAVHGAFSDHRVLAEQLRPLSDAYEVVVYDVRGHGRTGGSNRSLYSMELFADDLAALLEALSLARPVVCGHSMGGMVVQTFGARYPETPAALVTMGTQSPRFTHWTDWVRLRLYATVMYHLTALLGYDRLTAVNDWVTEHVFRDDATGRTDNNGRSVAAIRADHPCEAPDTDPAEFRKVARAIRDFFAGTVGFEAVTVPTLVLYGETELDMTARHAAHMAELLPRGRLEEVPGAGHSIHVDRPAALGNVLRSFLDETVGPAAERP